MRRSPRVSPRILLGLPLLLAALHARSLPAQVAQATTRFTVDDVLTVRNAAVGDVSPDGRWAVITLSSLRDRLGVDNSRFGDPTYTSPGVAEITVVDTRSGESRKLFPDKRQARGWSWSPDGAQLAFMLREGDEFRLTLWDRARNRMRTVPAPSNRLFAENSASFVVRRWTHAAAGAAHEGMGAEGGSALPERDVRTLRRELERGSIPRLGRHPPPRQCRDPGRVSRRQRAHR